MRHRRPLRVSVVAAGLVLAAGASAFLGAAAGLAPTKASGGHWAITEWFLQFTMQRSASTQSLGVTVPPLDDPNLVLKGAAYFDFGCRSCHGAPGAAPWPAVRTMLPPPPDLAVEVPKSNPRKLFHIVKHGIKFTGMPAFPSQERDDEVWALVAFLQKLPGMDAATYRSLSGNNPAADGPASPPTVAAPTPAVTGPAASPPTLADCRACHGARGEGRGGGAIPRIAGQRPDYLLATLRAYRDGRRSSGMMHAAVAALDDAALERMAHHFAAAPPPSAPAAPPPDPTSAPPRPDAAPDSTTAEAELSRGRRIAHEGIRERRVPACLACHAPAGRPANPAYPSLAGQSAGYLANQLTLFQQDRRGGTAHAHLMRPIAKRLTAEDVEAVVSYLASLPDAVSPPGDASAPRPDTPAVPNG